MRCPDCSKFVSQEMADPEVEDSDCKEGNLTATVRIVAQCAECSGDLKEARFEVDENIENFCIEPNHTQSVNDVELSSTERGEGTGRYRKTFYGAEGTFKVSCSCGLSREVSWKEDIAASGMDELV